jgi:excisionase family DNA binding protein
MALVNVETPDDLLTAAEVAGIFRVSTKTVWRWAVAGKLPGLLTPGGHHRFRRADVDRLAAGRGGNS